MQDYMVGSSGPGFDNREALDLLEIQRLQFSDTQAAERALLLFLQLHENPSITKVELRPKPESLNSMNGFITIGSAERYFFKTHVEQNEKVSEYYNADRLKEAGYPVISARQISHIPGRQLVLYEIVHHSTLFDLLKFEEDQYLRNSGGSTQGGISCSAIDDATTSGKAISSSTTSEAPLNLHNAWPGMDSIAINNSQVELDRTVFEIYERTLEFTLAEHQAAAPIHQLFYHRLADDGRFGLFYSGQWLMDRDEFLVEFETLAGLRWTINGVTYPDTLQQLVERARDELVPGDGPSIVGHGDAHNGNLFVDESNRCLLMFDPAFAGRHNPFLDQAKPLFHNVFARWMYFPEQTGNEFQLSFDITESSINISHSFIPSPLRQNVLHSRLENVLKPTIALLRERNLLQSDWRSYLRSALFCCPLLTVNLLAPYVPNGTLAERYHGAIKLLAFSLAIEFGSMTHSGSNAMTDLIDTIFV